MRNSPGKFEFPTWNKIFSFYFIFLVTGGHNTFIFIDIFLCGAEDGTRRLARAR